jgi:hypothetical protein
MREPLPLATIHDAILEFLRNRDDAVLFGAQAVNAYVDEPRMTQDVDILSTRGREFAEELREHLAKKFTIATCVRSVAHDQGFRVYQLRQPKNRHLADVRHVQSFPPTQTVLDIRVLTPEELIAQKLLSLSNRSSTPNEDLDRRDLKVLLLEFPHLKAQTGPVSDRLCAVGADDRTIAEWERLVASEFEATDDEAGY